MAEIELGVRFEKTSEILEPYPRFKDSPIIYARSGLTTSSYSINLDGLVVLDMDSDNRVVRIEVLFFNAIQYTPPVIAHGASMYVNLENKEDVEQSLEFTMTRIGHDLSLLASKADRLDEYTLGPGLTVLARRGRLYGFRVSNVF